MKRTSRWGLALWLAASAGAVVATCPRPLHAQEARVIVLAVSADSDVPAEAVRAAIAKELGAKVVLDGGWATPGERLDVRSRNGSMEVRFRDERGRVMARSLAAPADTTARTRQLALLAGNLARNEADDLLGTKPTAPAPVRNPVAPSTRPRVAKPALDVDVWDAPPRTTDRGARADDVWGPPEAVPTTRELPPLPRPALAARSSTPNVREAHARPASCPRTDETPPAPSPKQPAPGDNLRLAGWVTLGAGVFSVALGTMFALAYLSVNDDIARSGLGTNAGNFDSLATRAHMFGTASQVTIVGGLLAIGTGAILGLSAPSPSSVTPQVGIGPQGLRVGGAF